MAKQNASGGAAATRLLTLSEVAKRTGISMPTLQKYKRQHADRIPSKGKGRRQRYPEEALETFRRLRTEGLAKRGRPRKNADGAAGARGRRRRGAAAGRRGVRSGGQGLLTLTQVAQRTGISYPTLLRYVKTSLGRIPHQGSGRRRRFKPEAVEVFRQLRKESRPGRPPGSGKGRAAAGRGRRSGASSRRGGDAAVKRLQASVRQLEQRLSRLERELKKPLRIEVRR